MTYERDPQKVEILVQELLKRTIENNGSSWNYEVDQNTGEVDVMGSINMDYSLTGHFPFKFRTVDGTMSFRDCEIESLEGAPDSIIDGSFIMAFNESLTSLKGFPRRIDTLVSIDDSATLMSIPPYEWRYALLSDCDTFNLSGPTPYIQELRDILIKGRSRSGSMPSELIPGKIAQLKELKYKGKRK